ncbi:MAG: hypothetical protein AAF387_21495 [Pseudomonadota bacterium]
MISLPCPFTQAEGFLALDMADDAWQALEELPPEQKTNEPILQMRVEIAIKLKRWQLGATVARGALRLYPECAAFYVDGAECVRHSESLEAARELLALALVNCDQLPAIWHFRMACYSSRLGDLDVVSKHFRKAKAIDADLVSHAADCEDLRPWFDSF